MDDGQRRGEAWAYEVDGRGELGAVFFFGKKDLLSGFRKIEKWSNRQLDKRGFYELETSGFNDMEGDIGGYPIPQYRKKKWQIPKYRVENRLNTDTAYFNHIYNRLRILMVASI